MEYGKDLEQLMNELQGDKLEVEPPKTVYEPEQQEESEQPEEQSESSEEENESSFLDTKGLPELIVGVMDIFLSTLAVTWTKTDDKAPYKLDEDEKEQLIRAWDTYLKNKPEVKFKPETVLIMTTLIIYTPKAITAINARKQWKQAEEL